MGALYIATVVSAVLYGLCLLQAFLYFQSKLPFLWCLEMIYNKFPGHKRDQWYIKAAVSPPKIKAASGSEYSFVLLQVITVVVFDGIQLFMIAAGGKFSVRIEERMLRDSSSQSLPLCH